MYHLIGLLPALPFAGFAVLAAAGTRMPRRLAAGIGAGTVGLAFAAAVLVAARFMIAPPDGHTVTQTLWTWIAVGGFRPEIAFTVDPLSVVMMLVVTGVGFLIHVYSTGFMAEDEALPRFFAYMNLFVGSMLVLVLADNLLLLYLGWEGVGLCSYLLIGFWYRDAANGAAARKAFIVTRVGDAAMAVGLFLLVTRFDTLHIATVLDRAAQTWPSGSGIAIAVAALLLGGAVGKSAQLPLQTWLPDAMAGPTPVSALIHAATMVTAGVYLIARTNTIFLLAPPVMAAVAIIGAATLLVAGFSALGQRDIKRILAYSTISQLGYMFLALGVGAFDAAIFHLMTHAFFKALLFLAAGAVIHACHHEHDIFKLGGLRRKLPVTFWAFLAGGGALSGLPLVTAGFYSKDLILSEAFTRGSVWLWLAGLFGALLTAVYTFRLIFVAFFGEGGTEVERRPGLSMRGVLVVLSVLAVIGGFVEVPKTLGGVTLFSDFLGRALPHAAHAGHGLGLEYALQGAAAATAILGVLLAWAWFRPARRAAESYERIPFVPAAVHGFWAAGFRFDALYDLLFVRPYVFLAETNRGDVVDLYTRGVAGLARGLHFVLSLTQTGRLRWYAGGLVAGSVMLLALMVMR